MRANITLSPRQLTIAVLSVAGGGALGCVLRDLLVKLQTTSTSDDWTTRIPWMLLAINVVGVYTATKLLRGPLRHHDPNDITRLLLITGLLGGFTSYSGLFVDLAALWHLSIAGSICVAVGAVLSGVCAAWLGLGRRHVR